jgi:hypothetical protein
LSSIEEKSTKIETRKEAWMIILGDTKTILRRSMQFIVFFLSLYGLVSLLQDVNVI